MSDDEVRAAPDAEPGPAGEPGPGTEAHEATRAASRPHPVLVYTGLRILLLAVTAGVLWLLGLRQPLLLLVFAFLVSGVISVFALNRPREVAAEGVVTAVQRVNQRIEASKTAEDDLLPAPPGTSGADGSAARSPDPAAPGEVGRAGRRETPPDDDLDHLEPSDG